jgi:predicted RNA-binding protein with PIN domain
LLRPAIDLAWRVARHPAIDPPRGLRPFLRYNRLPARGVVAIRRVLDDDAEFRARIAAEAPPEEDLGRASWLFVTRPSGWADELAAMSADVAEEQRASRRLAQAEARIARLESDLAAAQAREAKATEELAAVRRAHALANRRVDALIAERDAGQAEIARLLAPGTPIASGPASEPAPVPPPDVDVAGLRTALEAAADAARASTLALEGALAAVPPAPPAPTPAGPPPSAKSAPRPRRPKPPTRRPVALPPGLRDDSVAAAEHLVRVNGVLVLVDGYNATISMWPNVPLSEQRHRLVDALAELVARTGADAHVVFDGAEDSIQPPLRPRSGRARPPVRVLFSPADVPADDVILELVDQVARHRAVVVASDDRQVQEGARSRGANVLSRAQLLAMLRRGSAFALG